MTKKQREELRGMFGGKCAYCGKDLGKIFHTDHVKAVVRLSYWDHSKRKFLPTGKMDFPENDSEDNLFPACPRCNIAKTSMSVEEFRRWIKGAPLRVVRYENPMKLAQDFGLMEIKDIPVVFWFEKYLEGKNGKALD